jgi:hypothetical protein
MSPEVAAIFHRALAMDPEDRHQTLVEFLGELIHAYPLPPHVRDRVQEQFRQDTQTQDVLPLVARPLPRQPGAATTDPGTRASQMFPTERMDTMATLRGQTTGMRKIELDEIRGSQPERPPAQRKAAKAARPGEHPYGFPVNPVKALIWVVLFLAGVQLFWWIYGYLSSNPGNPLP